MDDTTQRDVGNTSQNLSDNQTGNPSDNQTQFAADNTTQFAADNTTQFAADNKTDNRLEIVFKRRKLFGRVDYPPFNELAKLLCELHGHAYAKNQLDILARSKYFKVLIADKNEK